MKQKAYIKLCYLSFILSVLIGCVPPSNLQQKSYDDYDQKKVVKAKISIDEQWDRLYDRSKVQWKKQVKQSVLSGNSQLPDKHLVLAIKSFNSIKDRDICLEAAYKFLYRQGQLNGELGGDNKLLFSKLVEYTLRNPESFDINRLHYLCEEIQDDICYQLKQ